LGRHAALADRIADAARNYAELVRGLFAAYARSQGAEMAGDKSAFFNHMPLERMDAAVSGQARFIHVIRDGRDVCLSWLKIKVGPRTLAQATRAWARHVAGKRAWGALHPDHYHELRYEDLLTEPEKTLRTVCGFAGIPYSDALLGFHAAPYARDIANSTTHGRLSQPLDPGNRGKWRAGMTAEEVAAFEAIAGSVLADCGYPLAGSRAVTARPSERSTEVFSIHRLRLALKSLLPACALIAVRLHLPLDRLCNSRPWLRVESWLAGGNGRRRDAGAPRMIAKLFQCFPPGKVCKWAVVGVLFMGVNLSFLYALVDLCRLPVPVATFVTLVVGTLLRFLANDRFVFQQRRPTWARLKAYCTAIALGAAVWYAVANALTWLGVYYLLSAIAATGCSVGFNFTANFLWVWRKRDLPSSTPAVTSEGS
jgi:putative flippase GtrA